MDTTAINGFRKAGADFQYTTVEEVRALFRACMDAREDVRNEALGVLLYPEISDLPGYYTKLFAYLASARFRIVEIPVELLQIFCELIGSACRLPENPRLSEFFQACIAKAPSGLWGRLLERRFPAEPFLNGLGHWVARTCRTPGKPRSGPCRAGPAGKPAPRRGQGAGVPMHDSGHPGRATGGANGLGVRWRILRRILAAGSSQPMSSICFEITLADLMPLFTNQRGFRPESRMAASRPQRAVLSQSGGRSAAAWRRIAKHLAAPALSPGTLAYQERQSGSEIPFPINAGLPPTTRRGRVMPDHPNALSEEFPFFAASSFTNVYWGGAGNRRLLFWELLAREQAGELAEIVRLSEKVSAGTGRVVLSWHNASLAAAGGWGFDCFASRFPSRKTYSGFVRSVLETAEKICKRFDATDPAFVGAAGLSAMRVRRIFAPKAAHALENLRAMRSFGPFFETAWTEAIEAASTLLSSAEIADIAAASKSEWSGAVAPHQRVSVKEALAWAGYAGKIWSKGLALLLALTVRGQEALDSGVVPSFVIPWIDKFFISSRRRADQGYLEALVRLVRSIVEEPLILFWEDTSHAERPSCGLALEDLRAGGLPFRGIGIFDSAESNRSKAADIIAGEYPRSLLFALRPLNDRHFAGSTNRVFEQLDFSFFRNYDSSWKDNLVFVYSGTQVFPLLSVQTEMEATAPWVSDGRGRYPFGAWFRRKLRCELAQAAVPKRNSPGLYGFRDPLWEAYSEWANLL